MPKVNCTRCGKELERPLNVIKRNKLHYCGWDCHNNREYLPCAICGNPFYRTAGRHPNQRTCSRSCAAKLFWREGFKRKIDYKLMSPKISKSLKEYFNGDPTKNPAWRGGHPNYRGPKWNAARKLAREYYGDQCAACGITAEAYGKHIPIHHKIPVRMFKDYDDAHYLDNLMPLCQPCHMKVEKEIWKQER